MAETRISQMNPPPCLIDLGSGNPDLALFQLSALNKVAERYFVISDPRNLQ